MSDKEKLNQEDILKKIKNLDEKINSFSEILQKFGLDIITQFGKSTHNLKILIDKINEIDKSTIEIKGLTPQLSKIIDNQNILESELDLIKSLIQRSNISMPNNTLEVETIERNESITKNKQAIKAQFTDILNKIDNTDDSQLIKKELEQVKENIFETTGGHKISYEISQVISKLNSATSLSDSLRNLVKEKIGFWINKL